MERRILGRTGLEVSVLSFGCGAVGGLMVKGSPEDQHRAVARAIEAGINYFDTATIYGNGESERNLGRVLRALDRPDVLVGTKVWLTSHEGIGGQIAQSMDASLQRLGRESVDLYQLHNPVTAVRRDGTVDAAIVRDEVLPAFARLRAQGKARFFGFTALGDTPAIRAVLSSFDTAQVSYNVLNPSAGLLRLPPDYPGQDYDELIAHASEAGTGTIGIRVLAGGALSGVETRHPLGMQDVEPIGSASTYAGDVARARRLDALVSQGFADSLVEAALRYVISNPRLTTTLVGLSTVDQFEYAVASVNKGPLPPDALALIARIQAGFAGEPR